MGGCPQASPSQGPPAIDNAEVIGTLQQGSSSDVTLSCTATDPDSEVDSVTADLSQIGGDNQQQLESVGQSKWSWSGKVATDKSGKQTVSVVATDTEGNTDSKEISVDVASRDNQPPSLEDVSLAGSLQQKQKGDLSISCKAKDHDSDSISVSADLSQLGGSCKQPLDHVNHDTWSWSGQITCQISGTITITITAQDQYGAANSQQGQVDVSKGKNDPPTISDATVTGGLKAGTECSITASCVAYDSDGQVQSVVADLSAIGGSDAQALQQGQSDQWSWSGQVTPPDEGTFTVTFLATDNSGGTGQASVDVTVLPSGGNAPPTILDPTVTGDPDIAIDQLATITASATVIDVDDDVASVTADLSEIGGSSAQELTEGNNDLWSWQGDLKPTVGGLRTVVFEATDTAGAKTAVSMKVQVAVAAGTERWRFATEGAVESSPAIGLEDVIYIGSCDDYLYAVNPDGTKYWAFHNGQKVSPSASVGADGTIYLKSQETYLFAINPDGTEQWRYAPAGGPYSTPAIGDDGTLYVGCSDGSFLAVKPDGTLKWSVQFDGAIISSAAIGRKGVVYVSTTTTTLYALNIANGSVIWPFGEGCRVGVFAGYRDRWHDIRRCV